jgi:tryptophan-rich sensory protein
MRDHTAALLAAGAVIGATTLGGRYGPGPRHPRTTLWYARLDKPSWTPSGATIGAAWTVVDAFLTVSGARLLIAPASPDRTRALALWGFNVASIWGWQRIFFGSRALTASVAYVATMVTTGLASVGAASRVDRVAAATAAPYPAWVGFAGLLTGEIWRRNR